MDSPERADRVRAAIANAGFAVPTGRLTSVTPIDGDPAAFDLGLALGVLLSDPSHAHLRRDGWIAWGQLCLDGTLVPIESRLVNDLHCGPCVGRIWDPLDQIPQPEDDAVISLVDVADLKQAWDVIVFFAMAERTILGGEEVDLAAPN